LAVAETIAIFAGCAFRTEGAVQEIPMRVSDVMTKNVVSVSPQTTVADALDIMVRSHLSGVPVIDESGRLVGMISEGDFLRRSEFGTTKPEGSWIAGMLLPGRAAKAYAHIHGRRVGELMSENVATIAPNAGLDEAVALMEKRRVKRLPVLETEKVVGILTRADFMRALVEFIRPAYEEQPIADGEIKRRIEDELRAQPWAPVASVEVAVENGAVVLRGLLTDERQRNAIRAVIENVDGVRVIRDHMTWIDPFTATVLASPDDEGNSRVA
jgi:CBS domain-containing protein